jgi:S-formylglutathione hydrolase FrmB
MSAALGRLMTFRIVLPQRREDPKNKIPVIYFLHGRGRSEATLFEDASTRSTILSSGVAIVLPRGDDGWYINSPAFEQQRYADYLDEVIEVAEREFPLRNDAHGRAIGGWSMGGYGAAYTAARRPNDFAALGVLIGVLDYPRDDIEPADQNYPVQPTFGADKHLWAKLNPRLLLPRLKGMAVFVGYARNTPERTMNERFITEAESLGLEIHSLRMPGEHVFPIVRQLLTPALDFLEARLLESPAMDADGPPLIAPPVTGAR